VSAAVIDTVVGDRDDEAARSIERKAHADLLRDIFGPAPLHPILIDPSWRAPTVAALAQAAYEERQLPPGLLDPARLAVLCDALEEAGCPPDHRLLLHLRGPAHTRGCFAVDLILGRQSAA
jgi:hypothetical protein